MARLRGGPKLAYIPTPERIRPILRSYLSFPTKETTIFDPCCGNGTAIKDICPANNYFYGIELHTGRAIKAKKKMNRVLVGPFEDCVCSHWAFGFIHLNPPNGWVPDTEQRYEETFLYRATNYLVNNGVLEYIVPTAVFESRGEEILKFLLSNYRDLKVYKYPDPEYKQQKHVVIFGCRKSKRFISPKSEEKISEAIKAIRDGEVDELEMQSEPFYKIPVVSNGVLKRFRVNYYDAELAQYDSQTSDILQEEKPVIKDHLTAPFLLDKASLALLAVGGYLDGSMPGHYLLGKYENSESHAVTIDNKGRACEVTTKKSTTVFYALCKKPDEKGSRIAKIS